MVTGSLIETFEGSSSVCDSLGNLLFYTNGGGREPLFSGQNGGAIWNKNNAVMYDMQGTEGGGFSAAQSSVIVEAPAEPNVYYVFTMDEIEYNVGASPAVNAAQPLGRGLRYFKVDMSLNAGLGAVVVADQPVYLPSYEGLCAIRHRNKRDYWILINQDSTGIGVYSLTPSGVAFVSSFTAVGGSTEVIKASPDGTKLRVGPNIFDFDDNTGIISNPRNLNSFTSHYEFSPNSRYLYEIDNFTIRRFDLLSPSFPASSDSIGLINVGFGTSPGQMQLGPDGKIYFLVAELSLNIVSLNRINCPNTASPSIQPSLFSFPDFFFGLPNFPAWIFKNDDSLYVSLGPDTVRLCAPVQTVTLDARNPGSTYLWSTGDQTQSISVSSPGTYSVTVTGPCGSGTDQVVVSNCATTAGDCLAFTYTGAPQQWVVPSGVDSIRVKLWGAAGGGGPDSLNNFGGSGGYTEVVLPVVAGDQLQIVVGGGGQAAQQHNGGAGGYGGGGDGGSGNRIETIGGNLFSVGGAGGGGGLSLVRMLGSINNILGIAGGGGGGSYNRAGGAGGGLIAEYSPANNPLDLNGFGGTQIAGGAPSANAVCPHPVSGTAGAGQQGGTGATDLSGPDRCGGGGGGGGYFGGGGGGSNDGCFGVGSAGGGGSGFVCSSCPGLYGFSATGTTFSIPPNNNDPDLLAYPGVATGFVAQNGGNGLVLICPLEACTPTTDTVAVSACGSYTNPLGATYTTTGTYLYTLRSIAGCDSNIVLNLTILQSVQTAVNISACDAYTAGNGITYTGDTVVGFILPAANGCDSTVTLNLNINQSSVPVVLNARSCDPYTSSWGTVYSQSGVYSDTSLNASGCDSVSILNLTIDESAEAGFSTFSEDSCAGTVINFLLGNEAEVISAVWNFGDPGSGAADSSTLLRPQHRFETEGIYRVQSIVQLACQTDTVSAFLRVFECSGEEQICRMYIPAAFSPNADGVNDEFRAIPACPTDDYVLQIYNRWGERIFLSLNPANPWNGTYQETPCPMGVYVYSLRYRFKGESIQYINGNVSLIR